MKHTKTACGVNLGSFYGPTRAVEASPIFEQEPEKNPTNKPDDPPLHIALVKIRAPQLLGDGTIHEVSRTLSQLGMLGLTSIIVVDCEDSRKSTTQCDLQSWRRFVLSQADRIVSAIDAHAGNGARRVDNVIGISDMTNNPTTDTAWTGNVHVMFRRLLMTPLRRGVIPVIAPLGYTQTSHTAKTIDANDIILALTREFAGVRAQAETDEDPNAISSRLRALRKEVLLDRLIILDPLGGIPASHRANGYHVFLNMEQEFESVRNELLRPTAEAAADPTPANETEGAMDVDACNPSPELVEVDLGTPRSKPPDSAVARENHIHIRNLDLVRNVLALLPPSSSALLTTPEEAANTRKRHSTTPFSASGVGTRRQRNPLIHNLLTDKPVFSSSLPVGRLAPVPSTIPQLIAEAAKSELSTTFAKRGMPITIFPDLRKGPWEPPAIRNPRLTLQDPRIDLSRLVHLIEDSFNRKLDVEGYLRRVNHRIAGVIIAGQYEGGAILTWEMPPGVVDDGSEESRARMVPYLDKFAVLKRSQGSGGVADIVFKTMVRDCFPEGVCWRSRKDNPVNKWYFERSRGTWKVPDTNWTMFWTTPDLTLDHELFEDYKGVCKGVIPSWADNKAVVD